VRTIQHLKWEQSKRLGPWVWKVRWGRCRYDECSRNRTSKSAGLVLRRS
jgi:hypothetical protein